MPLRISCVNWFVSGFFSLVSCIVAVNVNSFISVVGMSSNADLTISDYVVDPGLKVLYDLILLVLVPPRAFHPRVFPD